MTSTHTGEPSPTASLVLVGDAQRVLHKRVVIVERCYFLYKGCLEIAISVLGCPRISYASIHMYISSSAQSSYALMTSGRGKAGYVCA